MEEIGRGLAARWAWAGGRARVGRSLLTSRRGWMVMVGFGSAGAFALPMRSSAGASASTAEFRLMRKRSPRMASVCRGRRGSPCARRAWAGGRARVGRSLLTSRRGWMVMVGFGSAGAFALPMRSSAGASASTAEFRLMWKRCPRRTRRDANPRDEEDFHRLAEFARTGEGVLVSWRLGVRRSSEGFRLRDRCVPDVGRESARSCATTGSTGVPVGRSRRGRRPWRC